MDLPRNRQAIGGTTAITRPLEVWLKHTLQEEERLVRIRNSGGVR